MGTLSEGQGSYYILELNLKQKLRFDDKNQAETCRENIRTELKKSGHNPMLSPNGSVS